jgi:hypothetical protein
MNGLKVEPGGVQPFIADYGTSIIEREHFFFSNEQLQRQRYFKQRSPALKGPYRAVVQLVYLLHIRGSALQAAHHRIFFPAHEAYAENSHERIYQVTRFVFAISFTQAPVIVPEIPETVFNAPGKAFMEAVQVQDLYACSGMKFILLRRQFFAVDKGPVAFTEKPDAHHKPVLRLRTC